MPKQVCYTPEGFLSQRTGGVSRYFCEVARVMSDGCDLGWNATLHAAIHGNRHLRDLAIEAGSGRTKARVIGRHVPLPGEARRLAYRWSAWRFATSLANLPSVIHDTGHRFAATETGTTPVVVTIHDLINDEDPAYRRSRPGALQMKASAIARARRIVVPSFATRDALIRVHGVEETRIDVIHHGSRMPGPDDRDPVGVPYLLHVGSRGRYKDFATLMRAFAIVRRGGFDGIVINVGGGSLRGEEHALRSEIGLPVDSIRAVGADDEELATLYAHARALAVPSRIEGFGIPILEAMSLGCPVACMEAPGCAEVAGDAALLAPIGDSEALAANLERLIDSSKERTDLVERGLERAARFTWAESARKHVACYEQCLG